MSKIFFSAGSKKVRFNEKLRSFSGNPKAYLKNYMIIYRSLNQNKTWNCFYWKPNILYDFVTYCSLLLRMVSLNLWHFKLQRLYLYFSIPSGLYKILFSKEWFEKENNDKKVKNKVITDLFRFN